MTTEFDYQFQELFTQLVEEAFELVNNDIAHIEHIYIYVSLEGRSVFFNLFYLIDNEMTRVNLKNSTFCTNYAVTKEQVKELFKSGLDISEGILRLFETFNREVPTLMKITYEPKTGKFNNDISYENWYLDHPTRTAVDGFEEWYQKVAMS